MTPGRKTVAKGDQSHGRMRGRVGPIRTEEWNDPAQELAEAVMEGESTGRSGA